MKMNPSPIYDVVLMRLSLPRSSAGNHRCFDFMEASARTCLKSVFHIVPTHPLTLPHFLSPFPRCSPSFKGGNMDVPFMDGHSTATYSQAL